MKFQSISNVEISVKEIHGQRVVTFGDIDAVHGRPNGTASRNFRANRKRFIEGEDFYIINQPDEIRRLGYRRGNQRKIPFADFIERNFALSDCR